ncbi:unnamed protein product, partial [Prorocentrum cordatum]
GVYGAELSSAMISRAGFQVAPGNDGESSIAALKRQVGRLLASRPEAEVGAWNSGVDDSHSNGMAERAILEAKANARKLLNDPPLVARIARRAAMAIDVGRRGVGGKAPQERRRGMPSKMAFGEFGENASPLHVGARASRLGARFRPGVYSGIAEDNSDALVGVPTGEELEGCFGIDSEMGRKLGSEFDSPLSQRRHLKEQPAAPGALGAAPLRACIKRGDVD